MMVLIPALARAQMAVAMKAMIVDLKAVMIMGTKTMKPLMVMKQLM